MTLDDDITDLLLGQTRPRVISDLHLEEISFVDSPANPGARFVLLKRQGDHNMDPIEKGADAIRKALNGDMDAGIAIAQMLTRAEFNEVWVRQIAAVQDKYDIDKNDAVMRVSKSRWGLAYAALKRWPRVEAPPPIPRTVVRHAHGEGSVFERVTMHAQEMVARGDFKTIEQARSSLWKRHPDWTEAYRLERTGQIAIGKLAEGIG